MKFTKEEACKELVAKIPGKGQALNLSERSINEQLDALMPLIANEETELDDFITKVLPIFKTADSNVRHGVSVGIKKYQDEHPAETKKTSVPEKEGDDTDATKELLKRIEELERKDREFQKRNTISQRRSSIVSKMNEKGCKDKEWIDSLLEEVNLDGEEFDEDARVEKYMKMYNKSQAKMASGATPEKPNGNGSDSYLKDILKAATEKAKSSNA